jgi:hypothetical protein
MNVITLTVIAVCFTVVSKESFFRMAEQLFPSWNVSVAQLRSVFGFEKVDQKH